MGTKINTSAPQQPVINVEERLLTAKIDINSIDNSIVQFKEHITFLRDKNRRTKKKLKKLKSNLV